MGNSMLQRASVVQEARRWLGTPYHHRASVLGVGVDCALLLREAFAGAGLMSRFDPGNYTCDWHLHRGEEKYLATVMEYAHLISPEGDPSIDELKDAAWYEPATVLLWRVGRTFSHGGMVTEWPFIIHSYLPAMMVEEVDVRNTPMSARPMRAFSYWGDQ